MRGRPSSKLIAAGVLAIVGVALAGASLAGPWWSVRSEGSGTNLSVNFGLFGLWDPASGQNLNYATYPNMGGAMQVTMLVVLVSLITGTIGAMLAFVASRKPALRWGSLLGVVGGALGLAAGGYLAAVFPAAVAADLGTTVVSGFWGSTNVAGVSATWGAGWAWYLVIVAGVLMLVGGLVGATAKAPASTMAPPYGYPAPPAPAMAPAPAQPMYTPAQPTYAPGPTWTPAPPTLTYPPPPPGPVPPMPTPPAAAPPSQVPAPMPPPASASMAPPAAVAVVAPPPAASPGQKFCANCGATLPDTARFCRSCGTPA